MYHLFYFFGVPWVDNLLGYMGSRDHLFVIFVFCWCVANKLYFIYNIWYIIMQWGYLINIPAEKKIGSKFRGLFGNGGFRGKILLIDY